MILGAAGPLTRVRALQLGNDLVDRGRLAADRVRDSAATERPESLSVSRKIHFRNRNLLSLDITPDVDLSPVEQRLNANMFSFGRTRCELSPEFRRLIRSEEHTSELQSRGHLVCRLLL